LNLRSKLLSRREIQNRSRTIDWRGGYFNNSLTLTTSPVGG
jgi:hypothetical protein